MPSRNSDHAFSPSFPAEIAAGTELAQCGLTNSRTVQNTKNQTEVEMKVLFGFLLLACSLSPMAFADVPNCGDGSYYVGDPDSAVLTAWFTTATEPVPWARATVIAIVAVLLLTAIESCADGSYYVGDGQCCPNGHALQR